MSDKQLDFLHDDKELFLAANRQFELEGGVDFHDLHAPEEVARNCFWLVRLLFTARSQGNLNSMRELIIEELEKIERCEVNAIMAELRENEEHLKC